MFLQLSESQRRNQALGFNPVIASFFAATPLITARNARLTYRAPQTQVTINCPTHKLLSQRSDPRSDVINATITAISISHTKQRHLEILTVMG